MTLTYWQRRHLERQLHSTCDARVYRRTLAVLEVADGQPVVSIARRLRVTLRAVYHWVATYSRDHAPDALVDRDRSGRPRLLTPSDQSLLRELLSCSPQQRGYFAAQWTVPLLRQHLTRRTGPPLSDDTLRRELESDPQREKAGSSCHRWLPACPPGHLHPTAPRTASLTSTDSGNRTAAGAKAQGMLMSVMETCRRHTHSMVDHVSRTLRWFGNRFLPRPVLLPRLRTIAYDQPLSGC